MKHHLILGRTYRAIVTVDPVVKAIFTPEMLANELRRYQLYGTVSETTSGYIVEAEFRGRSGIYELPAGVQSVDLVR